MSEVRGTQTGLEVGFIQTYNALASQMGLEVVAQPVANAVVPQAGVEVLFEQQSAPLSCFQVAVEVAYILPQGQIYVYGVQF